MHSGPQLLVQHVQQPGPDEDPIFQKLVQLGFDQYKAARQAHANRDERAIVPYRPIAKLKF